MDKLNRIERCIVNRGLIPELLRDGFRESQGEYVRDVGTVRQFVAVRRSNWNPSTFQIPIGLSFPQLGDRYKSLFRFVPPNSTARSMTVHRSSSLPEIDGAGDYDWCYDGRRDADAMSQSIVHSWREYGRSWFDRRSTLTDCAQETLKEGGRVRAAIFFLAAGEQNLAEAALREELSFLKYRDHQRIRNLRRCAKEIGINLPPPSDESKWKRRNPAWRSQEGWDVCINPYHAQELLQDLKFSDRRLIQLTALATVEQYCKDLTSVSRQALREAVNQANGAVLPKKCTPSQYQEMSDPVRYLRYIGHAESVVSTLSYLSKIYPWNLGPRFANEDSTYNPEQIAELTNHCSASMHIIRDIIGNPFTSFRFNPTCRTESVVTLAREIFDHSHFELCPILADVLEENGYHEPQLLNHLRSNERHYDGCWAIDAILGIRETMPFTPPRPSGIHNAISYTRF